LKQDLHQIEELLQEDFPAKTSALLARGLVLLAQEAGYSGKLQELWKKRKATGSSSKTSLAFLPLTQGQTSVLSSERWQTSGMVLRGGCLMLNTLEYPSAGAECSSLVSVIQTQQVQEKYYLTHKAAEGVLRRSNRHNKKLPDILQKAFEDVVRQGQESADQ
jgi:hypothetical protein